MLKKIQRWLHRKALDFIVEMNWKYHSTNGKKGVRLSFENRYIPKVIFHRTDMEGCEFNYAKMNNANFWAAEIERSNFSHANLGHSMFDQTNMFKCDMSTTNLRQVTHQIHIRNRQKEDMIKLWDAMDRMEDSAEKAALQRIMRENFIQRPRVH